MAKGYLVANITVIDPAGYAPYGPQVAPVVEQYGGRFLIRGGQVTPVEGDIGLERLVVLEFASVEAAKLFYHSPEYAPLLKLRMQTTRSLVAFVEGYPPQ